MRRRSTVLVGVVVASAAALTSCRDGGGPPAAVCDPLDEEVPTELGLGEEPTLGEAVIHGDRIARGARVQLIVYLDPDAPDQLPDLADAARAMVADDDRDLEVYDQEATYDDYVRLFAEDSPELVGTVTPENLPTSVMVETDDGDAADEFLAEIERFDVFRVLDSRGAGLTSGRLSAYTTEAGAAALEALSEQDDDVDVAAAATVLLTDPTEVEDEQAFPDPVREAVERRDATVAALATLAAAAEACG